VVAQHLAREQKWELRDGRLIHTRVSGHRKLHERKGARASGIGRVQDRNGEEGRKST